MVNTVGTRSLALKAWTMCRKRHLSRLKSWWRQCTHPQMIQTLSMLVEERSWTNWKRIGRIWTCHLHSLPLFSPKREACRASRHQVGQRVTRLLTLMRKKLGTRAWSMIPNRYWRLRLCHYHLSAMTTFAIRFRKMFLFWWVLGSWSYLTTAVCVSLIHSFREKNLKTPCERLSGQRWCILRSFRLLTSVPYTDA